MTPSTIIPLPHGRMLVQEVPEGKLELNIVSDTMSMYFEGVGGICEYDVITLPPGDWQLIGVHPGLTEEQAERVVERYYPKVGRLPVAFWNYPKDNKNGPIYHATALESLSSLLTAHNLPTDKRLAILFEHKR